MTATRSLAILLVVVSSMLIIAGARLIADTDGKPGPSGDGGTTVVVVTLDDGTRCATMDAPQGKAIDCDWGAR